MAIGQRLDDPFAMIGVAVVNAAIMIGLLVRCGFLASVVFSVTTGLVNHAPLTLDSGQWYYERGMFVILLLSCVAALACYTAVMGRSPILKRRFE
jgi:hypothetical protein